MKTPKLKACRMWANRNSVRFGEFIVLRRSNRKHDGNVPVALIPLDDVEALIDQAASAIAKWRGYGVEYAPHYYSAASSVLAAIGVPPFARKGRK